MSPTSDPRPIDLGAQVHMQTIPAAPLLTPLSVPSSPSSSFFLDQSIDAGEKQSHKAFKSKDVPSLCGLDNGEDEVDNVAIDEERPLEKSHWSDDSDVDGYEDIEDQLDNKDSSGKMETSKTVTGAKDKETDEEAFKVEGKEDMDAAILLQKSGDEMAEANCTTHDGNARRLDRISVKPVAKPSIHDDLRE